DTIAPVITATGTTFILGCNPSAAVINAALGTATATDNCGPVTPSATNSPVTAAGCSRSQTRTWNATDACNNAAIAVSRTITWTLDTIGPVFTFCPPSEYIGCNPTFLPGCGEAIATDDCGSVSIIHILNFPIVNGCNHSQSYAFIATDDCGNTSVCYQTFTWTVDTIAPVIVSHPDIIAAGCQNIVTFSVSAADNCGGPVTVTSAPASGSMFPVGVTTVVVTATDGCGNSANHSFTVTVNAPPVCNITPANPSVSIGNPVTLTASGGVSYIWSTSATTASITVSPSQTTTYTVTVTNAIGCTASCSVTVTVNPGLIGEDDNDYGDNGNGNAKVKAYPNPFDSKISIEFTLPKSAPATVEIYNLTGSKLAVLFNGNAEEGVTYKSEFNGEMYPPGVYFYRIVYDDVVFYNKITLIK
ncbi:MAG: T9SS type A sorting domain-containing protein, partial [Bacteroidia bacterium]|nr:T9SS type A sorting domain-containing protein [Bacteroidia bacterium]